VRAINTSQCACSSTFANDPTGTATHRHAFVPHDYEVGALGFGHLDDPICGITADHAQLAPCPHQRFERVLQDRSPLLVCPTNTRVVVAPIFRAEIEAFARCPVRVGDPSVATTTDL